MKPKIAYAIVKKKNPKINVMDLYAVLEKGARLEKDEKWVKVIIKSYGK